MIGCRIKLSGTRLTEKVEIDSEDGWLLVRSLANQNTEPLEELVHPVSSIVSGIGDRRSIIGARSRSPRGSIAVPQAHGGLHHCRGGEAVILNDGTLGRGSVPGVGLDGDGG